MHFRGGASVDPIGDKGHSVPVFGSDFLHGHGRDLMTKGCQGRGKVFELAGEVLVDEY
jgi:hypothetical protein